MDLFSRSLKETRSANAKALAAFGVSTTNGGKTVKVIRRGTTVTLYTVGYEKRDAEDLMSVLRDQGVKALADVREKPMSRKPDFRAGALKATCESVGIEYQPWACLGSTSQQRDELQSTGDFRAFAEDFRAYAMRVLKADLDRLAASVQKTPTALICYERDHAECHRSVIADLVADAIGATVVAL